MLITVKFFISIFRIFHVRSHVRVLLVDVDFHIFYKIKCRWIDNLVINGLISWYRIEAMSDRPPSGVFGSRSSHGAAEAKKIQRSGY